MEEILKLQQMLKQVQTVKNKPKLSERNVIDILNWLIKKQNQKVIFSEDGNEFYTLDALDKLIYNVIKFNKKIRINEISNKISISPEIIYNRISEVCLKFQVNNVEGILLTNDYLEDVFDEINEILQEKNEIKISDIMLKYDWNSNYLTNIINSNIGGKIKGVLNSDKKKIITEIFDDLLNHQILGCINSSAKPINILDIIKITNIDENYIKLIISNLIDKNKIKGKIIDNFYLSDLFIENRKNIVINYLEKDKYIDLNIMKNKLLIKQPKKYLDEVFQDNIVILKKQAINKKYLENQLDILINNTEFSVISSISKQINIINLEDLKDYLTSYHGFNNDNFKLINDYLISLRALKKFSKYNKKIIEEYFKINYKPNDNLTCNLELKDKKLRNSLKSILIENKIIEYNIENIEFDLLFTEISEELSHEYLKLVQMNQGKKKKEKGNYSSICAKRLEFLGLYFLSLKSFYDKIHKNKEEDLILKFKEIFKKSVINYIDKILIDMCYKSNLESVKELVQENVEHFEIKDLDSSFNKIKLLNQNDDLLESLYKKLPNDCNNFIHDLLNFHNNQSYDDFEKILSQECLKMGIGRIVKDSKNDKNFVKILKEYLEFFYNDTDNLKIKLNIILMILLSSNSNLISLNVSDFHINDMIFQKYNKSIKKSWLSNFKSLKLEIDGLDNPSEINYDILEKLDNLFNKFK